MSEAGKQKPQTVMTIRKTPQEKADAAMHVLLDCAARVADFVPTGEDEGADKLMFAIAYLCKVIPDDLAAEFRKARTDTIAAFERAEQAQLLDKALDWACRKLGSCAGWLPDYIGAAPEHVDFERDTWKRWREVALAQAKEAEVDGDVSGGH